LILAPYEVTTNRFFFQITGQYLLSNCYHFWQEFSSLWMGFFIDVFQLFNGIMRVYLGCCKAAVAEELFDCIEIGTII
jgi:hypothetical protein